MVERKKTHKLPSESLTIAVSARALFDMEESNQIFLKEGQEAYEAHHKQLDGVPLEPGSAFHLVKALLALNEAGKPHCLVEVVVLSSVHPAASLRVINSIRHYGLGIERSAFTGGEDAIGYLEAFGVDLLLSRSEEDVQRAVDAGFAAAQMYAPPESYDPATDKLVLAFDGDAVLFSDESELYYRQNGKEAFYKHEAEKAEVPMKEGPFTKVLRTLHIIQKSAAKGESPLRIAIVTARGGDSRERVLRTLEEWDIAVDQVFFLSGLSKDRVLSVLRPQIFFDDQDRHVSKAARHVPSGKVPLLSNSDLKKYVDAA